MRAVLTRLRGRRFELQHVQAGGDALLRLPARPLRRRGGGHRSAHGPGLRVAAQLEKYRREFKRGLIAGIQQGNTSEIPARKLVGEGILASIRLYAYDGILDALGDLEANRIGCIIKLHPVITELVRNRPKLYVPLEIPTHEKLGIAFAKDNTQLCEAVNTALDTLTRNGTLEALGRRWITP